MVLNVKIDPETGEVLDGDSAVLLPLEALRRDGGTQSRAILDEGVVQDYAAAMRNGTIFPPIGVVFDGTNYWLWDGFHRVHAALECGFTEIRCEIEQGTHRDAVLKACGANPAHGLRRTNADKRRAALTLLNDAEWSKWSDSEIARRCAVSQKFVSEIRRSLKPGLSENASRTYTTKHGTTATMNTSQIGKADGQFKPAVPEDTPAYVSDAVDLGIATSSDAVALTTKLKIATDWTRHVASRYAVLDADTLDILDRLHKDRADSCTEIETTGFIQPGEDYEAVHISASAKLVQDALRIKSKIHQELDDDEKPQTLIETKVSILGMSEKRGEQHVLRVEVYLDDIPKFKKLKGKSVQLILKELPS